MFPSLKSFFWIICLANILKNFRWLKIRFYTILKHLKCPRCYSLSLRYSIYKVQCPLFRSRWQLIYSSTLKFICQELFSSFFKFLWGVSIARCSREQLRYVSTSASICQALFSRFFKFLTDLLFICAARKRLAYTSTQTHFCQALFYKFLHFFLSTIHHQKRSLFRGSWFFFISYPTSSLRP